MSFIPTANNEASRVRIEPGVYKATCVEVHDPALYYEFQRWYLRVDFAIHEDGAVVSKYVNLDGGETPRLDTKPRSDYYKLWTLAAGRKPAHREPMDPAIIKGLECRVKVIDKCLKETGEIYSAVSEALSLVCSSALPLSSSITHTHTCSSAQTLNHSGTQVSGTQAPASRENVCVCVLEELPADKVEASPVSPNNGQNSIPAEPDPITLLLRAFGKVDGGCVVFHSFHQKQLPPLLEKYGQQELVSAYKQFTGRLNLDDKGDTEWAAKSFLAQADSLCHNARRKKKEAEETKVLRDQTAAWMQEQAEQERLARAEQEKIVDSFDPLAD